MKKSILNSFILAVTLSVASFSLAETFNCPTLHANEMYFYLEWIDEDGNKIAHGAWNQHNWRLWIHGDSYFTPKDQTVATTPLIAHYFASTNTWYLKCTSADLSVGPRNNIWPYANCALTATGFECTPSIKIPVQHEQL